MSNALTTPAALTSELHSTTHTAVHLSDPSVNALLGTLCVTVEQREIYTSTAHDVEIIGSYDTDKICTRPSYVCGILIQSRGDLAFPVPVDHADGKITQPNAHSPFRIEEVDEDEDDELGSSYEHPIEIN
ncbi:hypothetical protein K402DRAFT_417013 [Aulographum hederae CBS 113979]|uniref:Uncharacterized protein n=1 Tax=Aulographum hederae CBS 113979 TaxID=1176131 RepID=A0A6G1HFN9_9PEZI|nr:hypothetical protein K402DRAFT_417013 [Aulographum hederae CBS 113979]